MSFFASEENRAEIADLLTVLELEKEAEASVQTLAGKTFVITGSLQHFENREALKAKIEALGGKVAGSVSAKSTALINNDAASASTKNQTAKKLGIPILTEEEFLNTYGITY